ncbi:MAG: type II secretion system protein [bacterium]|nr:type II secretion system protein [bacterium]
MTDRTTRYRADRHSTAFTLIEMLIVVAIISILATLVIPAVHRAVSLANTNFCKNNLHVVAVSLRVYLNESAGNTMPRAAQMPSLGLSDDPPIAEVLSGYLPSPKALACPSDDEPNENGMTFFESEGSSYEYHTMLGGKKVSTSFLVKNYGPSRTPVMNDYKPFHGAPGTSGAMNFLFADCSVGDLK